MLTSTSAVWVILHLKPHILAEVTTLGVYGMGVQLHNYVYHELPFKSKLGDFQVQLGHQHLADLITLGKDPQLASIVQWSALQVDNHQTLPSGAHHLNDRTHY